MLSRFLSGKGFAVDEYADGAAALLTVMDNPPNLILIGGDSQEIQGLVTAARMLDGGDKIPMVALTPKPGVPPEEEIAADFYLGRPFQNRQLFRLIESFRSEAGFTRPRPGEPIPRSTVRFTGEIPRSGSLEKIPFHELFARAWGAAVTGVVALKSGGTWRRVDFWNGFPISARSNLVTEHLLRYLLRLGIITPDGYRDLLPSSQGQNWDARAALVSSGVLDEDRFNEAHLALVQEIVLQCFKWEGAAFRFREAAVERGDDPVELNPFAVYNAWLEDPAGTSQYNQALTHLLNKGLTATPSLTDNIHLYQAEIDALPLEIARFDGKRAVATLLDTIPKDKAARRFLVTATALGIVRSVPLKARGRERRSTIGTRPMTLARGRKFDRIRRMLNEDRERVRRARTPYAALNLPEGAASSEVVSTYQRYTRLYRAENFERIGDDELLASARSLVSALRKAVTGILGHAPNAEPRLPDRRRTGTAPAVEEDPDTTLLAETYFDDGYTYLRLHDYAEAVQHFRLSHESDHFNPKFLTYLGWSTYQLGRGDNTRINKAKDKLKQAIKLDNRNDSALYFLGCVYQDAGRLERAVDCWKRALQVNSGNHQARRALKKASLA